MNKALEVILNRRSSRVYTDKPVAKADLETIVNAAAHAPSAMNQQKWKFFVVTNPQILEEIRVAVRDCFRKYFAADPTHPLAADKPDDYCCFYGAPALVMVAEPRVYENAFTDGSCALQNMFLAAESLGIDSCWINQQRSFCEEPELRAVLDKIGVPADFIITGSAALGYASEKGVLKPRAEGTVVWVD